MDAKEWDDRYRVAELVWAAEPNRFVEEECRSLPPGRALDLAAGEGRNSVWLAGRGWRVTAVDFSEVGLGKGRRLADQAGVGDRVEWVTADVTHWTPPPGAYDLVVVAYLHLRPDELAPVLARIPDALAPGGRVVVVGHDVTNLDGGVGGPQDPDLLYRPEAIGQILAGAGLTPVRAETVERPTPNGTALDTLVTATREKERIQ
ncbi:MAG TPA: class I SAM-dependent methyltransferase [Acidimicrobiales bacterium]|nr:class I SAM-dependent methyltransferase [Acidimicrobiales bacterium]